MNTEKKSFPSFEELANRAIDIITNSDLNKWSIMPSSSMLTGGYTAYLHGAKLEVANSIIDDDYEFVVVRINGHGLPLLDFEIGACRKIQNFIRRLIKRNAEEQVVCFVDWHNIEQCRSHKSYPEPPPPPTLSPNQGIKKGV